ncbi:PLP-dependent transferase [Mytilinidion resinicola]|uniref:aromatic-amino-acid transaminase n=1 Tax=Mytilinidion resinicola TaxID=574789 RepID=A0A6A6YEG2_9PEZI|nr:PLP-dependent transferase [Mytilinidion resinicola]KAF2806958.1 PLP-dependent transferase [Mytilinidion resinicola]
MTPPAAIEVTAVTDTEGVTLPDPLQANVKSNDIYGRRKKSEKNQWGVAAPADAKTFRHHKHGHKPSAKNWDHRLSKESASREGSSLKQAAKYLGKPGIISLGGGLPSSDYFPFESLEIKVPRIGHFSEQETKESGVVLHAGKHDLAEDKSIFDIATAFNYGQGRGSAQLLRWVTEHTEMVHNPPYSDWTCTMSIGSTSGLDIALRMFAERGDLILSEEYTFATAVETAAPMGVNVVGVPMDAEGMLPHSLDHILSTWDPVARGARKPFLVYTVPTGQNPTGATQGAARRRGIYAVAQKHDLYILEDEPYYFLQMQPYTGPNAPDVPPPASHDAFLKSLVPSLLSMDVDGRVMRLDSFSKVLAPGSRVGWITASEQVVARYSKHADVSTQGPSGISQLVLFKLLDEHFGHEGYLDWLIHIRLEYTKRRGVILEACEKYLPKEVVSWVPPMAGMFHWLRIDHTKHPSYPSRSITDIEDTLYLNIIEHNALMMKGSWFIPDKSVSPEALFLRATFCAASSENITEAIRRVGVAVRESFRLVEGKGEVVVEGNGNGVH